MRTEKWLKENARDLAGKRVAITGATGDLGRVWCRYLAGCGASLILLDRNETKSAALEAALKRDIPALQVKRIPVDLEDMQAVKAAADALCEDVPDIFIHNAGAYSIPRRICDSGYDNVFQINFVSPYYIVRRLLPALRERGGRVIAVGSVAHNYSHADPQDVDFSTRRAASKVYGNAKRYLMFALYELFRDEERASLSIVHPGITFTNITAHYPRVIFALIKHPMKVIFMKPRRACLSLLHGVYEPCGYHEWIGPRFFDVWGLPKKRRLRTCPQSESEEIGRIAEEIYKNIT